MYVAAHEAGFIRLLDETKPDQAIGLDQSRDLQLVFQMISTESKDPFKCEGYPNKKNQKYTREIKIIDLLIDVLIYPFEGENKFLSLDELT